MDYIGIHNQCALVLRFLDDQFEREDEERLRREIPELVGVKPYTSEWRKIGVRAALEKALAMV